MSIFVIKKDIEISKTFLALRLHIFLWVIKTFSHTSNATYCIASVKKMLLVALELYTRVKKKKKESNNNIDSQLFLYLWALSSSWWMQLMKLMSQKTFKL